MNPIFRTIDDCRRALVQGSDGDEDGDFLDPGRAAAVYGTDVNGTTMDADWHRR